MQLNAAQAGVLYIDKAARAGVLLMYAGFMVRQVNVFGRILLGLIL